MTARTIRQLLILAVSAGLIAAALLLPWEPQPAPTPEPTVSAPRASGVSRGGRPVELLAPVVARPTATAIPEPAIVPTPATRSLGLFKVTGYSDEDPTVDGRGITRSGQRTRWGVAAVDPSIIPLGASIGIEGMGAFEAADTGGGVRGKHIDLWFPSRAQALGHGVQWAEVWRLP